MNRLTHERVNGIKTGYWSAAKKDELIQRLAEYENTGLEPEEIMNGKLLTGWVPSRERLPGKDGIYLICDCRYNAWVHTAGFKARSQSWCENHGIYYDDRYGRMSDQNKITAWMPLPEPYKADEQDGVRHNSVRQR